MSALPLSDGSARWFAPPSGQRPVLWCLPYAGGGAAIFRTWERALAPWVEVRPVFLPGREARFGEPAVDELACLADTLCDLTRPWAHLPQAWFGHSMGPPWPTKLCFGCSESRVASLLACWRSAAGRPRAWAA